MRSSRVRRVKRTARKSIGRALSRMNRSRGKGKSKRSNRSLVEELRETLSLPELESDLGILSVQKKKKSKKSKKKKKKSKAWSAKLHGKGAKGKKGKKSHKKKHKGKKMKGGAVVGGHNIDSMSISNLLHHLQLIYDIDFPPELNLETTNFEDMDMKDKDKIFLELDKMSEISKNNYFESGVRPPKRYEWLKQELKKLINEIQEGKKMKGGSSGKDKLWDHLSTKEKISAGMLGYDKKSWNADTAGKENERADIVYTNEWSGLTQPQQVAAMSLGMDEKWWHSLDYEAPEEEDEDDEDDEVLFTNTRKGNGRGQGRGGEGGGSGGGAEGDDEEEDEDDEVLFTTPPRKKH